MPEKGDEGARKSEGQASRGRGRWGEGEIRGDHAGVIAECNGGKVFADRWRIGDKSSDESPIIQRDK